MNDSEYAGKELDIFAHAKNWKHYWSSCVRPFLIGDVLEVGAGIGANTPLLHSRAVRTLHSWICLEPDPTLAKRAAEALATNPATHACKIMVGTTQSFEPESRFDTVLYIDVLEHIGHDKQELERAAILLKKGGNLIVLSPAHQWLYTAFDKSIGHFRRYDRSSLMACGPATCRLRRLWYLDSVGMMASGANRALLYQAMPTLSQIRFWDGFLVPPSTLLDRLLLHRLGKSILAVWSKD